MKTMIITGASSGIGEAMAYHFANDSYRLLLTCCHSGDRLAHIQQDLIKQGVDCITCIGDISDYTFVSHLVQTAMEHWGHIDVLINNAGISYVGLLTDMTKEDWDHIIATNLTSVFNTCRQVVPHMVSEKNGAILNISSVWGDVGASCEVAYSATKGGINSLTKALAKELAPSNIQVNAISCGMVDTPMNSCFTNEDIAAIQEEIPIGRMALPKEVAQMAGQLLHSPAYLTGQIIRFDGGWI